MALAERSGKASKDEIGRAGREERGGLQQSMQSRGLYNTTATDSVMNQSIDAESRAKAAVDERTAGQKIGILSQAADVYDAGGTASSLAALGSGLGAFFGQLGKSDNAKNITLNLPGDVLGEAAKLPSGAPAVLPGGGRQISGSQMQGQAPIFSPEFRPFGPGLTPPPEPLDSGMSAFFGRGRIARGRGPRPYTPDTAIV